jgi:hypothetical protein
LSESVTDLPMVYVKQWPDRHIMTVYTYIHTGDRLGLSDRHIMTVYTYICTGDRLGSSDRHIVTVYTYIYTRDRLGLSRLYDDIDLRRVRVVHLDMSRPSRARD